MKSSLITTASPAGPIDLNIPAALAGTLLFTSTPAVSCSGDFEASGSLVAVSPFSDRSSELTFSAAG